MRIFQTLYRYLLMAIGGTACFLFFYWGYPYHLFHHEQMLLFTYTAEQLTGYFTRPAVLACLCGDFLTQFFHYPIMGAGCLTAVVLVLAVVSYKCFRRWVNELAAVGLSLLMAVWECAKWCDVQCSLAGSLSLVGGFALFLLADRLKGRWPSLIGNIVGCLLGYWLFGCGGWIFALLILISALIRRKNLLEATLPLIVALLLPLVTASRFLMLPAQAFTYPATVWWGKPDMENERILGLCMEDYVSGHKQVDELVFDGQPTNVSSVCYNLANAMHGQLSERLMEYYQPAALGLFIPIDESSTYLSTQLAGEVWFQLGDMTMAEHAAILSMIFSPQNKNVRMVQRLAEINMVNGDDEAARKYLRILNHTLMYRQWAKDRWPGNEIPEVKEWLAAKRSLLPVADTLRLSSTDVVKSLHLLLEANPHNHLACEYLLCLHLLMKDLPAFAQDYAAYHTGAPCRLYAEALMIYLYRQRATGEEVRAYRITPETVKAFNEYNGLHTRSHGNPDALRNRFGSSYWFYFQFAQFQ